MGAVVFVVKQTSLLIKSDVAQVEMFTETVMFRSSIHSQ